MLENGLQYTLTTPQGDLALNPTNLTGAGFYVQGIEVGADVRVAASPRPQAHGGFLDDAYSDGLRVGLDVLVVGTTAANRQSLHDELAKKLWSLLGGTGTLKWTPVDGSAARQLSSVRLLTRPRVSERSGMHKAFSFELASPYATAEAQTQTTSDSVALNATGGGMTFPLAFPLTFTPSGGGTVTVTNSGTATAYPTLRVYGPITNPQVINTTADLRLKFTGTISSGDYLAVDLFERTVKMGGVTNRYDLLNVASSDWFGLAPGANTLRLAGSSYDAGTYLRVLHRDAWA